MAVELLPAGTGGGARRPRRRSRAGNRRSLQRVLVEPRGVGSITDPSLAIALGLFGSTLRIFFRRSLVSGREISGERGPSRRPASVPTGAGFLDALGHGKRLKDKSAKGKLARRTCQRLPSLPRWPQ